MLQKTLLKLKLQITYNVTKENELKKLNELKKMMLGIIKIKRLFSSRLVVYLYALKNEQSHSVIRFGITNHYQLLKHNTDYFLFWLRFIIINFVLFLRLLYVSSSYSSSKSNANTWFLPPFERACMHVCLKRQTIIWFTFGKNCIRITQGIITCCMKNSQVNLMGRSLFTNVGREGNTSGLF